jgi:FixJ family two-component response regulator
MWMDPACADGGLSSGSRWPHRSDAPRTDTTRTVLVVEDRPSVRALLVRMLASIECTVLTATSWAEALAVVAQVRPDVIVLDLRLPDSTEQDTLEAVFARRMRSQVIVVSGFLTVDLAFRAARLGAFDVLAKPVDPDLFVEAVRKALAAAASARSTFTAQTHETGDAASQFVGLVLRTLDADRDLKTLDAWARHVGRSVTRLRQACYLAHITPHDARDFVRALVAVVRSRSLGCECDLLLDINDTRTRDAFLARAGLTGRTIDATVEDFLDRQQFIPAGHEVLRLLRDALKR